MIVENGDIFLQEAKNIVSFVYLSYSTEAEEGSFSPTTGDLVLTLLDFSQNMLTILQ